MIEQYCRVVTDISNGTNLKEGVRYYRKNSAVEIEWDTNEDIGEEVIRSIIKLNKLVFNTYIEYAQRLDLGIAQSNIPLQAVYNTREKNNNQEFTQYNQGSYRLICLDKFNCIRIIIFDC